MDATMKSLESLWLNLAVIEPRITQADRKTFSRRLRSCGMHFITTELPSLQKDVLRALESGHLSVTSRFKCRRGSALPLFLNELFLAVFESSGKLRPSCDTHAIRIIRQFTGIFYKLEEEPSDDQIDHSLDSFSQTDSEVLSASQIERLLNDNPRVLKRARGLLHLVLGDLDPTDIVPFHSRGAVSTKLKNEEKFYNCRFIPQLDEVFPYSKYFFYNEHHLSEELEKFQAMPVVEEPSARLLFVPKDSRGPRTISCEPPEFMFIQQGLMAQLYSRVETHSLTKGLVNFTDQTINQKLARQASIGKRYATIDLKEASDRVSWELVKFLFPPQLVRAFEACRSRMTIHEKTGSVFELNKFAPMGSALCFPVEALVFWSVLTSALQTDVRVYGDDIILDNEKFQDACQTLESIGLKVNADKSYTKGFFRESCGGDYYRGDDVGYVHLRKVPRRKDDKAYVSFISFCNDIY